MLDTIFVAVLFILLIVVIHVAFKLDDKVSRYKTIFILLARECMSQCQSCSGRIDQTRCSFCPYMLIHSMYVPD